MDKINKVLNFNNITIRNKLLAAYILTTFIPMVFLGFYFTFNMKEIAMQNAIIETSNKTDRVKKRIEELFKTVLDVSDSLSSDEKTINIINTLYPTPWDVVEAYFEYKKYNNVDKILYRYSNELQNISFLSENHTLMNGPYIVKVDENFRDRHSYIDSFKTDKNVWWSFITSVNTVTNAHSIALLRRIIHNNKTLAVMIL